MKVVVIKEGKRRQHAFTVDMFKTYTTSRSYRYRGNVTDLTVMEFLINYYLALSGTLSDPHDLILIYDITV